MYVPAFVGCCADDKDCDGEGWDLTNSSHVFTFPARKASPKASHVFDVESDKVI
jgi:hypothetical protein